MVDYKLIILLVVAAALYFLGQVLVVLFVAFLLTTALLPLVGWLKRKKIPPALTSPLLIIASLAAPMLLLVSLGSAIAEEGKNLVRDIPDITKRIESNLGVNLDEEVVSRFTSDSGQLATNLFSITSTVFSIAAGLVLVLVITAYWLIYYDTAKKAIVDGVTMLLHHKRAVAETFARIEERLGSWVKGQVLVSLTVGLLTWLVLTLLGVPYAGVLAVIAALLEVIPTLGPILAAVPALLVGLTVSPRMFVIVLIAYIVIQQLESYLIAPRLLGRTVSMNPFAILLVLIIGAHLLGIVGALLAVPFTLATQEVLRTYRSRNSGSIV